MNRYRVIVSLLFTFSTITTHASSNVQFVNNYVTITSRLYTCTQVEITLLPHVPAVTIYGVRVKDGQTKQKASFKLTQNNPQAIVYADWAGLGNSHYRLYCTVIDPTTNKQRIISAHEVISVSALQENSFCNFASSAHRNLPVIRLSHIPSSAEVAVASGGALLAVSAVLGTGLALKKGMEYFSRTQQNQTTSHGTIQQIENEEEEEERLIDNRIIRSEKIKAAKVRFQDLPQNIKPGTTQHPERGSRKYGVKDTHKFKEEHGLPINYLRTDETGPYKPNPTAQPQKSILKKVSAY